MVGSFYYRHGLYNSDTSRNYYILQNAMGKTKERRLKNPIAKALQFFTSKRFKDKTKYTRKVKHGKNQIHSSRMGA